MAEWRRGVQRHSSQESHGDLSFLRESSIGDPSRPVFSMIGGDSPDGSTDVTGVLLSRRTIAGRDWLVFLVGSVKRRRVEDIRIALRSDDDQKIKWIMGPSDREALASYIRQKENTWKDLHPERTGPPLDAMSFPAESDVFKIEQQGNTITIREVTSSAHWNLTVPYRRDGLEHDQSGDEVEVDSSGPTL
ncbi:MAG: hypothetical protein L0Y44_00605 [Phycisphaerales bacterium]|nr:hypothetical protein [Phycisphaerales bacterium]MCI0629137.1 hypothetical protein [Phycisphaerales bacterium]